MKKLGLYAMAAMVLMFASCEKEEPPVNLSQPPVLLVTPDKQDTVFEVAQPTFYFAVENGDASDYLVALTLNSNDMNISFADTTIVTSYTFDSLPDGKYEAVFYLLNSMDYKKVDKSGSVSRRFSINNSTLIITFEDVNLGESGYWDGSDLSGTPKTEESWGSQITNYYGSFADNGFVFENVYTADWFSWKGFACSSLTDTETAGYANQYSVVAGQGAGGSKKFALAFDDNATFTCTYPEGYTTCTLKSMMVCNGTYAYLEMRDGGFGKKFAEGDWFKVTIAGYTGETQTGAVEYYLADFRDGKTFINNSWEQVDLTPLGAPEKVVFTFDGSDKGDYGLNTPKYVFIDNIAVELVK